MEDQRLDPQFQSLEEIVSVGVLQRVPFWDRIYLPYLKEDSIDETNLQDEGLLDRRTFKLIFNFFFNFQNANIIFDSYSKIHKRRFRKCIYFSNFIVNKNSDWKIRIV